MMDWKVAVEEKDALMRAVGTSWEEDGNCNSLLLPCPIGASVSESFHHYHFLEYEIRIVSTVSFLC